VSDPQLNFPEFQHALDIAGRGDQEMRGEDFLDHGAHHGECRCAPQSSSSLLLEPGVGQGRQHHVPLPAGVGTAFEVIAPQFLFELLVLLLDGPALVRGADQRWGAGGSAADC
jgi:hypothetical protein